MHDGEVLFLDQRRILLSRRILNSRISKSPGKLPKLDNYNDTGDLDEHIDHVDATLDCYPACGAMKCN